LVYRNAYCEIRKGEVYVKPSTRGRKKKKPTTPNLLK